MNAGDCTIAAITAVTAARGSLAPAAVASERPISKRVSRRSGAGPGAAAVHSGEEVFDDPPDDLHDGDAPPNTPNTPQTVRLARAARRPIAERLARSDFRLALMIPSANQPSFLDGRKYQNASSEPAGETDRPRIAVERARWIHRGARSEHQPGAGER